MREEVGVGVAHKKELRMVMQRTRPGTGPDFLSFGLDRIF